MRLYQKVSTPVVHSVEVTLLLNVKWRKRQTSPRLFVNLYDGKVWKECYNIKGKASLQQPFNLNLKLNVDWIQPYDRTQYSMGVIYMVVENLPCVERFKPEMAQSLVTFLDLRKQRKTSILF